MLGLVQKVVSIGQLTSGKGPANMGIHSLVKGATIPRKGLFLYINKLLYSSL
jgi:hypothetical protein